MRIILITSTTGPTTSYGTLTTYVVGGINTNSAFSGTISDGGAEATALVFNGPDSLTLIGSNTFSGGIAVNGGALVINNAIGSGTGSGVVAVSGGVSLASNGAISGIVSIVAGGNLCPGSKGFSTLTNKNDLSLDDASILQFQIGTKSNKVIVTGNHTFGGTLNLSNAGGFEPGTYTLFDYGGALSVGTLNIRTAPRGCGYVIDTTVSGNVNLIVSHPFLAAYARFQAA